MTIDKDLLKELRTEARALGREEGRALVDMYYQIQEHRKAAGNQRRAIQQGSDAGSRAIHTWLHDSMHGIEKHLKDLLGRYAEATPVGEWAQNVCGIGPVISAGLVATIDITKAATAGSIWRFAGLDPSLRWCGDEEARGLVDEVLGDESGPYTEAQIGAVAQRLNRTADSLLAVWPCEWNNGDPGERRPLTRKYLMAAVKTRPYNAKLKTLCWKIGESFIKVSSNENDVYGHLIQERMEYEHAKNDAGDYADQAERIVRERPNHAQVKTYKEGRLPDGHIFQRAKRWGTKLFLAHYHEVAYWAHYASPPPNPYIFEHGEGEHVHRLDPPGWERPSL